MNIAARPLTEWKTGLFDCCEDVSTCCYGFWCCPCLACTVSGNFGESRCLPLCDMCSPAITAAFGLPLCVPPAAVTLRVGIRHTYGIKGSLCKDIATSCFCEWCSWCQMHRELKYRKNNQTVIVNVQPQPVMMAPGNPPAAGFMGQPGMIMTSY
ncbi:cornifelin-like [Tautogolabrus adspersus]